MRCYTSYENKSINSVKCCFKVLVLVRLWFEVEAVERSMLLGHNS